MPMSGPSRNPIRQPMLIGKMLGLSRDQRSGCAEHRAGPVGSVDGDVGTATVARWDQLVDGGVDRRVLTADAGAGDEAEDHHEPESRREAADAAGHQVSDQCRQEDLLAADLVSEPGEDQGADDLAQKVDRGQESNLGGGQVQRALVRQHGAGGVDDLNLQTVEDPGRPEARDYAPVEPAPRQAVHPRRHQASNGPSGCAGGAHRATLGTRLLRVPLKGPL